MRALYALFTHHLKLRLEYRATFVLSLVLHPLVMLLILAMFEGIYRHRAADALLGYRLGQMVWYFGASQFFYYLVWNIVDKNISERVLFGGMDQLLVRPYALITWEFVQLLAHKVLAVLFEFLPVFLLYWLISEPDFMSALGVARYLALTALAIVQFFLLSFLFGVLAFAWQDTSSLNALKFVIVNVLAGVAMPIAFFPSWLQHVVTTLPFHYLFHTPVAYLLGTAPPEPAAFWAVFAQQLGWIGVTWLGCDLAYRTAIRGLTAAGG